MNKDDMYRHLSEVCSVAVLIEQQKTTNLNQNIAILENAMKFSDNETIRRSLANAVKNLRDFSDVFDDDFTAMMKKKASTYFFAAIKRNNESGKLSLAAASDAICPNEEVLRSEVWSDIFNVINDYKFVLQVWIQEYIRLML